MFKIIFFCRRMLGSEASRKWIGGALCFVLLPITSQVVHANESARVDENMCGKNNLRLVVHFLGGQESGTALEGLLLPERAPFSLAELDRVSKKLGYDTLLVRWSSFEQATFETPAILHIRTNLFSKTANHFIACFGETVEGLCVADFPGKPFIMSREQLAKMWTGDTLYIAEENNEEIKILEYRNFWKMFQIITTVATLVLLSIAGYTRGD